MYGQIATTGAGYLAPYAKRYVQEKALKYGRYAGAKAASYAKKKAQAAFNSYTAPKKSKPQLRLNKTEGNEGHTISKSRSKNLKKKGKKMTKAQQVLATTPPLTYRKTDQGKVDIPKGCQYFQNCVTTWDWTDLTTYGPALATAGEARVFIEGGHIKFIVSNATNSPITCTIYNYRAKQDLPGTVTLEQTISNGLIEKYAALTVDQVPWMNPKESVEFNNFFTILESKDITLSPGENHIHDFFFQVDRYFVAEKYTGIAALPAMLRGITHGIFIRGLGTLVTDDTTVSYSSGKIIYLSQKKGNYKLPQGPTGPRLVATLASRPSVALTLEKVMNEDTMAGTTTAVL